MKKLLFITCMLMSIDAIKAQEVRDDFNVGPYEVIYWGQGDIDYRLRKDVDLYEYFGLKKDTIIQVSEPEPNPLERGIQLSVFSETAMYRCARHSMVYGIEGTWKQKIADKIYLNGGISLGYAATTITNIKEDIFEVGVPIYVEYGNLNAKKASLYGGIGITPSFYSTMSAEYISQANDNEPEKYNGIYLAPHLDFGGYIPVGLQIIKVGVTWRYKINCSTKDYDLYQKIMGQSFIGFKIGVVL